MARTTNPNLETKKLYVGLNSEVYDALEKLAAEQGRTTSSLAAFALEHFLAYDAPKIYPLSRAIEKYQEDEHE